MQTELMPVLDKKLFPIAHSRIGYEKMPVYKLGAKGPRYRLFVDGKCVDRFFEKQNMKRAAIRRAFVLEDEWKSSLVLT